MPRQAAGDATDAQRASAFFADHLPQGKTTIRYRLRAESPGTFHALPFRGFCMYRGDVRCLSDETVVRVGERQTASAKPAQDHQPGLAARFASWVRHGVARLIGK